MSAATASSTNTRAEWRSCPPLGRPDGSADPAPDASVARRDFIETLRPLAHAVAVVTTDGPAGRAGATVSAFCSVSADPPRLLVCLNDASRTARCVLANGVLCLNVLAPGQTPIARRFSGMEDGAVADRFDGIALRAERPGEALANVPMIGGAAAFVCRVASAELSATHRVVIGDVLRIEGRIAGSLVYADGTYGAPA